MQLSLNGWPPITSHLAFLLFGFICSNMTSNELISREANSKDEVTVSIDRKMLSFSGENKLETHIGSTLSMVVRPRSDQYTIKGSSQRCILADLKLSLARVIPFPVIAVPNKDASTFFYYYSNKTRMRKLTFVGQKNAKKFKICRTVSEVSYGL